MHCCADVSQSTQDAEQDMLYSRTAGIQGNRDYDDDDDKRILDRYQPQQVTSQWERDCKPGWEGDSR